jgi:hypothetical protein
VQAKLAVNGYGKDLVRDNLARLGFALAALALLSTPLQAETPAASTVSSVTSTAGAAPEAASNPAPALPCRAGNLVATANVYGHGTKGSVNVISDNRTMVEGSSWSAPGSTVILENDKSYVEIDLGQPRDLIGLVIQADNNEPYVVKGSLDGQAFEPIWTAPAIEDSQGLRLRYVDLGAAKQARFLRVLAQGGDGFYSLSEVRAYCQLPKAWPPRLLKPPRQYGWSAIDNEVMVGIKGWLAVAGALLLLWSAILKWAKRDEVFRRTRDVSLVLLGLLAFGSWWNFGHFHFDHYLHIWEHYHYYIGAKYGPELEYDRLYRCTAAADLSDGMAEQVKKRKIRDLDTNELSDSSDVIKDPTICTSHFSEERWQEFRRDIRYFRSLFSQERWDESQNDHGYNATPVWAIAARTLTYIFKLSWDNLTVLGIVDSALLIIMWGAVWWAFGWRPLCVALIYWGYNFPARFYWNGGAFLRYDWLFWMVVGICLLKKDKMALGGASLTYATLLRIFPGYVVAGMVAKALYEMIQQRKFVISKEHQRFAVGCLITMAVLIPASSWASGGLSSWWKFAQNSDKHLETPLTNNMGLKTVIGWDYDTRAISMRNERLSDPFSEWKAARRHFYHTRKPLFLAIVFVFLIILARAGSRMSNWEIAALSTGLIAMAVELTCYYYGFLLTYGFLWAKRRLPGALAAALAAVTCLFPSVWGWNDDHFTAMSLATTITVIMVTAHIGLEGLQNPFPALATRVKNYLDKPKENKKKAT